MQRNRLGSLVPTRFGFCGGPVQAATCPTSLADEHFQPHVVVPEQNGVSAYHWK